jgi:chromosome partitioning protein
MGKIIALVNQKGGVGKTTSSINLASCLGYYGKKVLLVDLDAQGNATTGLGINKGKINKSIYELLIGEANVSEVILRTGFKNLHIIPATMNLAGAGMEIVEKNRIDNSFSKTEQLKNHLNLVKELYDYIIIDCPPSLGILTSNALAAADSVIIPLQCEFLALEGIMQLLNTIRLTQKTINPDLKIEGVLLTMLNAKTNLGLEVVEEARKYFKECVYDTIIPRLVKIAESPSHGKPINVYDPIGKGTEAYLNLAKEVIRRNETE